MPTDRPRQPPPQLGHVRPDRMGSAPPPRVHGSAKGPDHYPGHSGRAAAPRRARGGLLRSLIYVGLGFLVLLAGGAGLLLLTPPVEMVRTHAIAEVERQTGRKLSIGSARMSIASGLGVSLTGVGLSAPPTMGGPPLLTAERIDVKLALLPLIVREVKVERLVLVKPVLDLRVDGEGRRNWDFADTAGQRGSGPLRYAQAQAGGRANDAGQLPPEARDFVRHANPPGTAAGGGLEGLSLADVQIEGGTLRFEDGKARTSYLVSGIDAALSLPSLGGALTVRGHLEYAGERLAVDGRVEPVREALARRPAAVRVSFEGKPFSASYEGRVALAEPPSGEGQVRLKAGSAAALAKLFGLTVGGLDRLGTVSIEGTGQVSGGTLALSSAAFRAGETSGTGSISVDTAGPRPRLAGNLRFAVLDIDQIASLGPIEMAGHPGSVGRFAAPPAAAPRSIEDLIKGGDAVPAGPNAARVKGFRQRAGNAWDVEAIEAGALRGVDVDGRFQIALLKSRSLEARKVQGGVELKDGVLRASVTEGEMAGGQVRGLASIDARQRELTVGANVSGDSVALGPLLQLAGVDLLDGKGRAVVAVSARGASERELVSTLSGKADIKVTDGALVGWDADQILAGVAQGQLPGSARNPAARTPFRELSATFQIANGVARTKDLKLDSATVHAAGAGHINIVDRNIDLMLKPRVAQGGIEVPVRVAGPWEAPSVMPDVNAALKSPQAQEAVRQLKDGNVEGALRSVLGNGPKADKQIDRAKEALRGLLGR